MVVSCGKIDSRNIEVGSVVTAYNVSAAPVDGLLKFGFEKYTRYKGAAPDDPPPQPVDIFIAFLFLLKIITVRPGQDEEKSHAEPVKGGM
jgi:hypothetical protein